MAQLASINPCRLYMVFHARLIFLTMSLWIPAKGGIRRESWEIHLAWKTIQYAFSRIFTLQDTLIKLDALCKVENHENHVRLIYHKFSQHGENRQFAMRGHSKHVPTWQVTSPYHCFYCSNIHRYFVCVSISIWPFHPDMGSIPISIPPNSIWSIPIPIPHQIYQLQFQFKIDQFQFNSVYIFLYNLCKIFLIHLLP